MPRLLSRASGLALLLGVFAAPLLSAGSVGWRSDGTGQYKNVTPPTRWAEDKNVVWKIKLPGRSQGSPILVGDRLFVVSDPAELLCVKADDGEIVWRRSNGLEDLYDTDKAKEIVAE